MLDRQDEPFPVLYLLKRSVQYHLLQKPLLSALFQLNDDSIFCPCSSWPATRKSILFSDEGSLYSNNTCVSSFKSASLKTLAICGSEFSQDLNSLPETTLFIFDKTFFLRTY